MKSKLQKNINFLFIRACATDDLDLVKFLIATANCDRRQGLTIAALNNAIKVSLWLEELKK